ncbi:amino acid-binding ACT domain-containing protein [Paracoccus aestuariivivens]|uniref:Amino acid-binding ACT domain-containing protein n=1 Tax=Paracoccus aestuariivivens TaxID=1820333 RepID=A0A6L6JCU4_9RHOB|nr:amino acid-binding ACT domain-containing protein [Paracoccus aestuariivivens]MTH79025.1 amino acid-binding ACT domain-containing protein [Paracoccus aestuariivivens]
MFDLEFALENRPDALAELGEVMGRAGIPFEGGGVFTADNRTVAHYLFRDGRAAMQAAEAAGIRVIAMRSPLIRKLKQGTPGQLGEIARALADAGVTLLTQYSDHHNRLVLICDQPELASRATHQWAVPD